MIHRSSSELHFRQVVRILRRWWKLLLAFGLAGGGIAFGIGWFSPPLYTAKAQLLYDVDVSNGVVSSDAASAVETMVEMLLSPSNVRELTESLAIEPPQPSEAAERPDLSYEGLDLRLNAYKERQSRLVAVTFTTTDPKTAATVANRAADVYLEGEASYRRDQHERTLQAVAQRIPAARQAVDHAERALRAHRVEFGLTDTSVNDLTDRQIAELNRQLMVARSELAASEAELVRLRDSSNASVSPGSGEGPGEAPGLVTVVPAAVAGDAAAEIGSGDGAAAADRQAEALEQAHLERDAVASRIDTIERRLATLQHASTDTTQSWVRSDELTREASALGKAYEGLLHRQDDLLDQGPPRPTARLVTSAVAPDFPSSPSPLLFVAPGFVAALLLGGMLSVVLERLDQRLRTVGDIEQGVGVSCIGTMPPVARSRGIWLRLLREQPFAGYTEAIRGIFVASMRQADTRATSILLVTSCARDEGKTTLLASLAVYAAQLGHGVLVIDFDFRDPGIERLVGEHSSQAAVAVETPFSSLLPQARIRSSRRFGLDYLSVPEERFDPLSLIENPAFRQALGRLKQTYAYILIDSGPILEATETRLLAKMADRVILVMRSGATDLAAAQTAVQQLQSVDANFSVVLTQVAHAPREDGAPTPRPANVTG